MELTPGTEYDLTLRVKARVLARHDSHGLCLQLELEQRDYTEPRLLFVDSDEIEEAVRA